MTPREVILSATLSENCEQIFYADFFEINYKNVVIMGYGKSTAARQTDTNKDFGRDCFALKIVDNELFAQYDMGIRTIHSKDEWRKVDYFVMCLTPEETKNEEVEEVDVNRIVALSIKYPYPALTTQRKTTINHFNILINDTLRMNRLSNILQQAKNVKFLTMPFCKNIETKTNLYNKNII